MAKVRVELDEQAAADLHALVVHFRSNLPDDDELHPRFREAELSLAGALRSVGWEPRRDGNGGWIARTMAPRRRRS